MRGRRSALVAAAVLSVLAWVGWLAWDHEYQIDPATGVGSGPYEAWQVIGCVVTLLVAAVVAGPATAHPAMAAACVTLPFTVVWAVSAGREDETGLFLVGALLIAGGLFLGSWVVAAVSGTVARRPAR